MKREETDVRKYFSKILSSFTYGFLWMFTMSMAGFYYKLALATNGLRWYNYIYYFILLLTLLLLLRFFYRTWKSNY